MLNLRPTKATGGGSLYGLNYDDLSSYSNQIKSDVKYSFYTYVLETEKHLFESTDLIAISNIPLDIILPQLTVENLRLIAKCHNLKAKLKMKSQEIQSIENCENYVYIFQCIKKENKSNQRNANLIYLKLLKNTKSKILDQKC